MYERLPGPVRCQQVRNGLFSDQKGGNKLLSVAEISARQVLCCYQMLLPDGAGVARSLSLRLDATR